MSRPLGKTPYQPGSTALARPPRIFPFRPHRPFRHRQRAFISVIHPCNPREPRPSPSNSPSAVSPLHQRSSPPSYGLPCHAAGSPSFTSSSPLSLRPLSIADASTLHGPRAASANSQPGHTRQADGQTGSCFCSSRGCSQHASAARATHREPAPLIGPRTRCRSSSPARPADSVCRHVSWQSAQLSHHQTKPPKMR
jgi:hypothetical protein